MVITSKELLEKYNSYHNPRMKIKYDIDHGLYHYLTRGLYEDNKNAEGSYLASYILSPSYLSFYYVLSLYGLIPERVYEFTSATTLLRHHKRYINQFGTYSYQDVPSSVFSLLIERKEQDGYVYFMATKEKALCDTLYALPPVHSLKEFKSLLFDSLRIDEYEFSLLDFEKMKAIAPLYGKKNLNYLKEYLESGGGKDEFYSSRN